MHRILLMRCSPRVYAAAVISPFSSLAEASPPPLKVGDVLRKARRFSATDVETFAEVSGDQNPVHLDHNFARELAGFHGGTVVHGMLVASLFSSVIASNFPGAIYVSQTLQFKSPVYVEDEVVAEVQAIRLRELKRKNIVEFATRCFKGQTLLIDGEASTILPNLIPVKSQDC
ncbi:hypothetical protein HPP92_004738 [Vanilla planifolia]|uniref:MaoC-like domain-containing protein n=1 Tax=Vanilla planifolia TaxID=51239 RepID=A0A835RLJ0_VANPL|nr:hypothetical protein HPP92_004738 [Vanilla planifolia]